MMRNVFVPNTGTNTAVGGAGVNTAHSPVMGGKGCSNRAVGKGFCKVPVL